MIPYLKLTDLKRESDGLIDRVLMVDLGSKGPEFETHWRHCVVFLGKTLYPLLSTGST